MFSVFQKLGFLSFAYGFIREAKVPFFFVHVSRCPFDYFFTASFEEGRFGFLVNKGGQLQHEGVVIQGFVNMKRYKPAFVFGGVGETTADVVVNSPLKKVG